MQQAMLPGHTARWWQQAMLLAVGLTFALIAGVFLTAPAFHAHESHAEAGLAIAILLALIIVPPFAYVARYRAQLKYRKERQAGYSTIRSARNVEIRDSQGNVIPTGDKRLTASTNIWRALALMGTACAILAPLIWVIRVFVR